jgi:hypothetical protein
MGEGPSSAVDGAMEATLFTGCIYNYLFPPSGRIEGGASPDVARHRGGEKEERSHRCQQGRRLAALRFSAAVLHGLDGDSGRILERATFGEHRLSGVEALCWWSYPPKRRLSGRRSSVVSGVVVLRRATRPDGLNYGG